MKSPFILNGRTKSRIMSRKDANRKNKSTTMRVIRKVEERFLMF